MKTDLLLEVVRLLLSLSSRCIAMVQERHTFVDPWLLIDASGGSLAVKSIDAFVKAKLHSPGSSESEIPSIAICTDRDW